MITFDPEQPFRMSKKECCQECPNMGKSKRHPQITPDIYVDGEPDDRNKTEIAP